MRNLWGALKGLNTEPFRGDNKIKSQEARVDFSFKRKVFFIIAGGIIGGLGYGNSLDFLLFCRKIPCV
jgi:hypothetical protein